MPLTVARLSGDSDIADFRCDDDDLNDFLQSDALRYQEAFLANTTLLLLDGVVVCYVALAADSLSLTGSEKRNSGIKALREYPAMKIARLAADKRYQHKGIGTKALLWCMGLAQHLNDEVRHDGIACRFITVDAYPEAVGFYREFGFVENIGGQGKKGANVSLRYDVLGRTEDIAP